MAQPLMLLAVFDDIEPAAAGIERLQILGVPDAAMNVISGLPFPHEVLGRPKPVSWVPRIGMAGAILGGAFGLFLLYGTAWMYPLEVGGQPILPVPMGFITTFEMAMLGLMGMSFIGMFVDSGFPSFTPKDYVPAISDGKVAVFFQCDGAEEQKFVESMRKAGAESVQRAERRQL
jgi:hypothetical protein